jgi:hypothetical protein
MDRDHSFWEEWPVEPIVEGDNDTTLATRKAEYEKAKAQSERSDRVALAMKNGILYLILGIGVPLYQEGYHMDCQQSLNSQYSLKT